MSMLADKNTSSIVQFYGLGITQCNFFPKSLYSKTPQNKTFILSRKNRSTDITKNMYNTQALNNTNIIKNFIHLKTPSEEDRKNLMMNFCDKYYPSDFGIRISAKDKLLMYLQSKILETDNTKNTKERFSFYKTQTKDKRKIIINKKAVE